MSWYIFCYFCAAAAMQLVELEVGKQYINQQQVPQTTQMEQQQSNMAIPSAPPSVKTYVLTVPEKTCSCRRW